MSNKEGFCAFNGEFYTQSIGKIAGPHKGHDPCKIYNIT